MVAVRWYLRYSLSYRDVEELLAERGIEVDHVTDLPVGAAVHAAAGRRRPASPGTARVTGGSSTRRMSRSTESGATSTERSTSTGRSSTSCSAPAGTPTAARRFLTRALQTLKARPTEIDHRRRHRSTRGVLDELVARGVASRRAVREQPDRSGSRAAQAPAAADARLQADRTAPRSSSRACLRPEPAPRPLRTRTVIAAPSSNCRFSTALGDPARLRARPHVRRPRSHRRPAAACQQPRHRRHTRRSRPIAGRHALVRHRLVGPRVLSGCGSDDHGEKQAAKRDHPSGLRHDPLRRRLDHACGGC